jgi:alpha-ketoglutaric semialdehyde dehydrogenase
MAKIFRDASSEEVDRAMQDSMKAFSEYRKINLKERAGFLRTIADEMADISLELIAVAHSETNLDQARLEVELKRTMFQLTNYADACESGAWLDIRIDKKGGQPELRKMLVPLGPVVVFGASNFPFAYSTAGGDMACALAAGCTVVIKAHPAHAETSELVATAVKTAAKKHGLPEHIFIHLHGASFEVGKALIQHPDTKAVGFTGSFEGGKALFDLANRRSVPIPVFAEMGSVNPVFILPGKLEQDKVAIAGMIASSIMQSAGQFCTNPGILVGIENDHLDELEDIIGQQIQAEQPVKMLHPGIAGNFLKKRETVLAEDDVMVSAITEFEAGENESIPTLATVPASAFLENPLLQKEVFGPFSLLVRAKDEAEMLAVALAMEGQLTACLFANDEEVTRNMELIEVLKDICGRFVLNGVPTGVTVALSMHHGGPFPATTDSRFTAVGADGIKRFARPVCFQNWSNGLLPEELRDENPLGIWRTVNNVLTNSGL